MLTEAGIITHLKSVFPEQIGDDAAVIPLTQNKSYVVTKDLLIEDIHFRRNYCPAKSLAYKALQVNLSDIAAMGATPKFVLLGIAIPTSYENQLQEFLDAFTTCCKDASVILIGGDTTKSSDKLIISITLIGTANNAHIKYRQHAAVNDQVCVIGNLGYAHLGLITLESEKERFEDFKQCFLEPQAKVNEGVWLGQQDGVNAMMDISDGLFIDLQRLCEASRVGAQIKLENLPVSNAFKQACEQLKLDPISTQLTGGEDYGLLVTIKAEDYLKIADEFKLRFGYSLQAIGIINKGNGVSFSQNNKPISLTLTPFSHFGELK